MDTDAHRSLVKAAADILEADMNPIYEVLVADDDGVSFELLHEGKWVPGRFDKNIRIDQPTHLGGQGQPHASVYGRKGKELVVVNLDGTASHGTKGRLHQADADALRARGFTISDDNMVEWATVINSPQLLLS